MSSPDMNMGNIKATSLDLIGGIPDQAADAVKKAAGSFNVSKTSPQDLSAELASDGSAASTKAEMKAGSKDLKAQVKKPEVVEQTQQTDQQEQAASEGKETAERDVKLAEKSGRGIMKQIVMTDAGDDTKSSDDIAASVGKNYGKKLGQEVLKETSQNLSHAIDEAKKEDNEDKVTSLTSSKKKIDDAAASLGNSNYLEGIKDIGDLAKKLCDATGAIGIAMIAQKAGSFKERPGVIKALCNEIGDLIATAKSPEELQHAIQGAKNLKAFSSITTAIGGAFTRMAKEAHKLTQSAAKAA